MPFSGFRYEFNRLSGITSPRLTVRCLKSLLSNQKPSPIDMSFNAFLKVEENVGSLRIKRVFEHFLAMF
jgi:hypothetical protein